MAAPEPRDIIREDARRALVGCLGLGRDREAGGAASIRRLLTDLRCIPLDPLLWDRKLVQQIFDFDYVWEVYKPKSKRVWGYYVCPILHRGRLVGRFEARRSDGRLEIENLWIEDGVEFDDTAWRAALARHEAALRS